MTVSDQTGNIDECSVHRLHLKPNFAVMVYHPLNRAVLGVGQQFPYHVLSLEYLWSNVNAEHPLGDPGFQLGAVAENAVEVECDLQQRLL